MIFPNIDYERYFVHPWVVAQATEIRDWKVRSGNTKSLSGADRTPQKIYEDSIRGLAMECALFEFLIEHGKNKGWVVKRSEHKSHDIELTIGRDTFKIDVKTVIESRKGKTLSISPFEMRMARDDTLYLIFDVELGEAMFAGWVEKSEFRSSKFNGGGYVFWADVNLDEEDLPF